jgi:hypothetical protein
MMGIQNNSRFTYTVSLVQCLLRRAAVTDVLTDEGLLRHKTVMLADTIKGTHCKLKLLTA